MNIRKNTVLGNIDLYLFFIYLFLVLFGLMNIYSVSPEKAEKQLIWFFVTLVFILIIFLAYPSDYKFLAFPIYTFTILLLLGVLFLGKTINGAKAWYVIGKISFQPSEMAKISTSLAISKILSYFSHEKFFTKKKS